MPVAPAIPRPPELASIQRRYSPLATSSTHRRLSRYHLTVLRMPVSKVSAGFQPISFRIFPASMAYRRSCPGRSFT